MFTIFTNEQLAAISERRPQSIVQLREIDGIGEKKAAAYGEQFLDVVRQSEPRSQMDEGPRSPPSPSSPPANRKGNDELF